RLGERVGVSCFKQPSAFWRREQLRNTTDRRGNNRASVGHAFEHGIRENFEPRGRYGQKMGWPKLRYLGFGECSNVCKPLIDFFRPNAFRIVDELQAANSTVRSNKRQFQSRILPCKFAERLNDQIATLDFVKSSHEENAITIAINQPPSVRG